MSGEDDLKAEITRLVAAAADVEVRRAEQIAGLERAIESRDLIGQAKGIIMISMRCDADTAFDLLVKQSQSENRKLIDIAADIVAQATRQGRPGDN